MRKSIEATLELNRRNGKLSEVKVIMPTWNLLCEDGTFTVEIPVFEMSTQVTHEDDAEDAVTEAIKIFCLAAEQHGMGVERELQLLGWSESEEHESSEDHTLLNVAPPTGMFAQMMQTGDPMALELHI
jgi:hypothetical protein